MRAGSLLRFSATVLALALALAEPADGDSPPLRMEEAPAAVAAAFERSLSTATARLSSPLCARVFRDFRDSSGVPLVRNLEASGDSGAGYLRKLVFYDGGSEPPCDRRGVFAFTVPGSRVVRICSERFLEGESSSTALAAALLIHEELHSLGLGENPPSSRQITEQVLARCGR